MRAHPGMIFQDPHTSPDPRILIEDSVAEPLLMDGAKSRSERYRKARELVLLRDGLGEPTLERSPYEMSRRSTTDRPDASCTR